MIHAKQLIKNYGPVCAVDRLDLVVETGQIVGLLGPNGAGKSTTIRMLTGFLPPTAGVATVGGLNVLTDSIQVRKCIGYLPESTPLYLEMTVRQQLEHFGRLHDLNRDLRRKRIDALTDRCGLRQILDRPIGNLSKGNRQRAGIAQALLHDPPALVLDEPTAGLDPAQIAEIRSLIRELGQTKAVLLSTHILPEVEKTCDRAVILHRGRVALQGTLEELAQRARSVDRLVLECRADPTEVATTLQALPEVATVETTSASGWCRAHVTSGMIDTDIREAVAHCITSRNWPLRELRPETASLEELFVRITSDPVHSEAGAA